MYTILFQSRLIESLSDTSQIEQYYGTDDATTAFIFPSSLLGYLIATTLVAPIRRRLGLRGIAIVSPLLRIFAALIIASGPAFAILLSVNALLGLGSGLTDMAWNNWASNMTRPNVAQGLLHGSFSVGCIAGPAVAVAVLSSHSWYILYMIIVSSDSALLSAYLRFLHRRRCVA